MKAIQFSSFGGSEVLKLSDIEKPSPEAGEVLIKILATTVNPLDMKIRSGSMQKFMPVELPFTPGNDLAGIVEATGEGVTRLKKGDEVFATVMGGTYAEYITIDEHNVSEKPVNLTATEAASLAVPLTTSYTFLVEEGNVQVGQKVLIHGASGGVGSTMVQMAKSMGAYVIGTASGSGIGHILSLGVDEAIDYKSQDFSQLVQDADLVIDMVGGETQIKSYAIVKKGGKLLSAVMPTSPELALKRGITAKFIDSVPGYKKLAFGKTLVEQNKITTQIAKTLPLESAAEAQDLLSAGGVNGKIVLNITKNQ